MAAPTTAAYVKKTLANPEPSTHGPSRRVHHAARSWWVSEPAPSAELAPQRAWSRVVRIFKFAADFKTDPPIFGNPRDRPRYPKFRLHLPAPPSESTYGTP